MQQSHLQDLVSRSADAAAMLRSLANQHRLLVLCHLLSAGELSAGELVARSGLSQSALSQHLAVLRDDGLVTYRREAQSLFYRVADLRVERLLEVLRDIFCPELERPSASVPAQG